MTLIAIFRGSSFQICHVSFTNIWTRGKVMWKVLQFDKFISRFCLDRRRLCNWIIDETNSHDATDGNAKIVLPPTQLWSDDIRHSLNFFSSNVRSTASYHHKYFKCHDNWTAGETQSPRLVIILLIQILFMTSLKSFYFCYLSKDFPKLN